MAAGVRRCGRLPAPPPHRGRRPAAAILEILAEPGERVRCACTLASLPWWRRASSSWCSARPLQARAASSDQDGDRARRSVKRSQGREAAERPRAASSSCRDRTRRSRASAGQLIRNRSRSSAPVSSIPDGVCRAREHRKSSRSSCRSSTSPTITAKLAEYNAASAKGKKRAGSRSRAFTSSSTSG